MPLPQQQSTNQGTEKLTSNKEVPLEVRNTIQESSGGRSDQIFYRNMLLGETISCSPTDLDRTRHSETEVANKNKNTDDVNEISTYGGLKYLMEDNMLFKNVKKRTSTNS